VNTTHSKHPHPHHTLALAMPLPHPHLQCACALALALPSSSWLSCHHHHGCHAMAITNMVVTLLLLQSVFTLLSSSLWLQWSHRCVIIIAVTVVMLLCHCRHGCGGCTIVSSLSQLQLLCHCVIVAMVMVVAPSCHCCYSHGGCTTIPLLSQLQSSCGRMVIVVVIVVTPSCHCHCHSCIIFTVILAIVVGPWLEKAKCSWCKSSVFDNGYQV